MSDLAPRPTPAPAAGPVPDPGPGPGVLPILRRLGGWWLDRTLDLLPGWLTATGPVPVLRTIAGDGSLVPAPTGRRALPWVLGLGGVRLLTQRRELPLACLGDLRRVVALNLGEWTPLTADTAYFTATVERVGEGGALVRIDVLPRASVAPTLAAIARQHPALPVAIRVAGPDGPVDLPLAEPPGRRVPPRLLLLALLLLAPVLALAVVQESRLSQLRQELAAGALEAAQARDLGARVARLRSETLAAVELRRNTPTVLSLLDRLSTLLPDGSHLTELRLEGGRVHLLGYSGDGAALPALLDGVPGLTEVRLEAPLTRSGERGDRFHLSVRIAEGTGGTDPGDQGGAR